MARCDELFINLNNIEKLLKYEQCVNISPVVDGSIAIKTSKNNELKLTNKNAVKTVFEKAPEIKMLYLDKIKEMILNGTIQDTKTISAVLAYELKFLR